MAKIGLLSNRTRAVQRPPLLQGQVSAALLARMLPVIPRPKPKPVNSKPIQSSSPPRQAQTQAQARAEQPVRRKPFPSRSGQHQSTDDTRQNGRPLNGTPANGSKQNGAPTLPPSLHRPGGQPASSPPKNGLTRSSFAPPSSERKQREEPEKPARPVQLPFDSPAKPAADTHRDEGSRSARSYPSNTYKPPANNPPRSERPQPTYSAKRSESGQNQSALLPGLKKLFQQQPQLPDHAAVLGVGEDGFPVLLDLYDPAPGALVVIGAERNEQLDMLRSAVASLAMRSTPRSVQVMILTCEPDKWRKWMDEQGYQRFIIGIEGVEDLDSLQEWIIRFGDWIEQRRTGQRSGPPILLVMDTLSFLPRLSHDIRLNFEWMVKEGPPAQIWPLAAISAELAQVLSRRHLLRSFPTRILGYVDRPDFYVQFASQSAQAAQEFGQPGVFAVQVGDDWLRMRLAGH